MLAGAPGAFDAALGLGRVGGDLVDTELVESTPELRRSLFSGELFGEGPVRIVALEDAMAVAVETERNAVSGDQGAESAEIAEGIFGFQLEVSSQDLTGGVVLKTDERELGAAAFEPIMTAGIGKRHHAKARAGRPAGAGFARPGALRGGPVRGPPGGAH